MKIEQIYTGCLAQGAYYIESKGEAVVIDPLREVAPYIEKAKKDGARIKYVFETHFHADFVSGHIDLAEKTGAAIVYGPTTMKTNLQSLLLLAAAATFASSAFAQAKLYKWTDANGKVHYTDKMPTESAGRAAAELNKQGTVVRRTEAALTPEQKAELEREKQRKLEEEVAAKEQKRKDLALLNTYSSERDIDEARARALRTNEDAIKEAERKLADAQKRSEKLRADAEFYQKKPMPPQLKQDMQVNELELRTQTELIDAKKKEVAGINAKYDEDKRRFTDLTSASKTAQAGTGTTQR